MSEHKLQKPDYTYRRIFAVIFALLIAAVGVYTFYLYYSKDTAITYLTSSTAIDSTDPHTLIQEWDKVLAFNSPIGNDAALKWLFYPRLQTLAAIRTNDEGQSVRDALATLEKYTHPGMTQSQIEDGRVHIILYSLYGTETDYEQAQSLYLQAQTEKPHDPQVLFSLYCLNSLKKLDNSAIESQIVQYWGKDAVPQNTCNI